jgi:hypothetical protein
MASGTTFDQVLKRFVAPSLRTKAEDEFFAIFSYLNIFT